MGIIPITLDGRRRSTVVAHDFNGCASDRRAGQAGRSYCLEVQGWLLGSVVMRTVVSIGLSPKDSAVRRFPCFPA